MAQQTAVEWFFDKLKNHEIQAEHFELYQQAKQREREQIKNAYIVGSVDELPYDEDAQQYYTKTYGK